MFFVVWIFVSILIWFPHSLSKFSDKSYEREEVPCWLLFIEVEVFIYLGTD
jgi:hypothetical protein